MAKKYLDATGLTCLWAKFKAWVGAQNYAGGTADGGTANRAASIPFGKVDSTSTATAFTATVDGITELRDGVCLYLMNGVVTSAAASTAPKCFTLNVNGLGAKPVYYSVAAAAYATTQFNINYTMLFVYNTKRLATGCWDIFYGYDSNTNSIGFQLRLNVTIPPAKFKTYRYRLMFTSADGKYSVAANASSSTNATSARTPTTEKIDPFGAIVYYGYTTVVEANASFNASYLWIQSTPALGYSFNNTGAALTLSFPRPVYIKCTPQSDGSAIIDATTPYVQELPSSKDGKIYIFLGIAYSATNIELRADHPVYYHDGTSIRIWTGKEDPELAAVATSGSYNDLTNKPTIPTALSSLTTDTTHRVVTDAEKTTWNGKNSVSMTVNNETLEISIN